MQREAEVRYHEEQQRNNNNNNRQQQQSNNLDTTQLQSKHNNQTLHTQNEQLETIGPIAQQQEEYQDADTQMIDQIAFEDEHKQTIEHTTRGLDQAIQNEANIDNDSNIEHKTSTAETQLSNTSPIGNILDNQNINVCFILNSLV